MPGADIASGVVSAYALATRCPVLTVRMGVQGDTTDAFATGAYNCDPTAPLLVQISALSAYAPATQCPVLVYATNTDSTGIAHGSTSLCHIRSTDVA
eukprot:3941573-Rhodomonas_salina.2